MHQAPHCASPTPAPNRSGNCPQPRGTLQTLRATAPHPSPPATLLQRRRSPATQMRATSLSLAACSCPRQQRGLEDTHAQHCLSPGRAGCIHPARRDSVRTPLAGSGVCGRATCSHGRDPARWPVSPCPVTRRLKGRPPRLLCVGRAAVGARQALHERVHLPGPGLWRGPDSAEAGPDLCFQENKISHQIIFEQIGQNETRLFD
jgi:hypothetical protein